MQVKRAGEIMIPLDKYPHVPYWFSLRQAIVEMEKSEIETYGRKSLPRIILVFNEAYQLLGTVRRRDILRGLEPDFLTGKPFEHRRKWFDMKIDPDISELSYDKLINGIRERSERKISDVMSPIVETVDHDDNIMTIISKMVDADLSLIPVLKEGKVMGVVRSVDVFHEIAELVL